MRLQYAGKSTVTNGMGTVARLFPPIQQPDDNMLRSVGGECFTSGRVLRSCLPQGYAERPLKVPARAKYSYFQENIQHCQPAGSPAAGQGGGELRL